ncbi:MAG: AMP-binding protein, partial [Actinomycetales bacterium]|nr:AMP-binding protein [Actinomycetales bacterium]
TIATTIYTSGTTGAPKGCQLTHGNFRAELSAVRGLFPEFFDQEDSSTMLFLPLAHVFARIIQVGAIRWGTILSHSPDIRDFRDHLAEIKPTFLLAVPSVFEDIFNSASNKAWADGNGRSFDKAARTAIAWSRAIEAGSTPSVALRSKHALYSRLVYSKLREALGGKIEAAISGGAPLGERLGHFYRGIGINVLEGYGLTETTAAITVNTLAEQRIGTVGKPLPHTEVRVNADGELEFRGPQVFNGYLNNPEATQAVLSADGWFATGDLGEIDEDGFVRISGRKKEIIITAGGKNVAPALLEDRIRANKLISQCLVVGEGKPFVAALITVNTELWDGSLSDPELIDAVQAVVDEANSQVSRAEAIRKFVIVSEDWTEENGYLTPSFKLRRHVVLQDMHDTIEAMYVR